MLLELTCDSEFSQVGKEVSEGKVVIFPTDTVYGLGSSPRSVIGIRRCIEIKKRDPNKQMPILFSKVSDAEKSVSFNDTAVLLANRFWPGKLTLILRVKNPWLPDELIGQSKTLAVRVPNHECCLKLIDSCGGSLIGTSANLSGEESFTDPCDERLHKIAAQADFFVSGVCGADSLPSTIVDLTNPDSLQIRREGAIPKQQLISYLEKASKRDFSFSATTN